MIVKSIKPISKQFPFDLYCDIYAKMFNIINSEKNNIPPISNIVQLTKINRIRKEIERN